MWTNLGGAGVEVLYPRQGVWIRQAVCGLTLAAPVWRYSIHGRECGSDRLYVD